MTVSRGNVVRAWLRKLLVGQLAYLHQANKPDNTLPTLAERIDHLDSLLNTEGRQIKELRATLPLAPSTIPHSQASQSEN